MASEASTRDTNFQVWASQLQERFRQIDGVQGVWKTCPGKMGCGSWVCAPGQRQLKTRGCATFLQCGKGSYKNDGDQLVEGWTSCNRLKLQPRGQMLRKNFLRARLAESL